jgi:hypothetical protein
MGTRMQQRRGTAAEWATANPILAAGEIGFVTDTKVIRMGDGVTAWNDLDSLAVEHALTADTAANAALLDGLDSTAFLPVGGKAADSELLDGLEPAAFLPVAGKAADSELLDGLNGSEFSRAAKAFHANVTNPDPSIPNNAWTVVPYSTETLDEGGLHSTVLADSHKLIAPSAGILDLVVQVVWVAHATGSRGLRVVKGTNLLSGVDIIGDTMTITNGGITVVRQQCVVLGHVMASGDVISIGGWQNSGGDLAISAGVGSSIRGKFTPR